jgi:hypothetical protein
VLVDETAADEVAVALELELEELPPQPARVSATSSASEILAFIAGERYSLRVKVGADNLTRRCPNQRLDGYRVCR